MTVLYIAVQHLVLTYRLNKVQTTVLFTVGCAWPLFKFNFQLKLH